MSDWNCQIVKIEKVEHHPSADKLDVVTVLNDYPVIVKRDEYKVDDLAAYICIDSIVPDIETYHFLSPKAYEKYEENGEIKQRQIGPKYPVGSVPEKYRILKAKKILGIYSQGMLVPPPAGLNVGDSIVEVLQLTKWIEPEEDNLPTIKSKGANAAPPPKGFSIPHYDLDGARKYINCLLPNEEIVLTEKLHGCFKSNTKIILSDGSRKPICSIKNGDFVLGRDSLGNLVPTKVINVWNNGVGGDWFKVKISRSRMNRGASYNTVTCTSNHKFYNPENDSYIAINNMNVGDTVSYYREDISIPEVQRQVLLGKLLGDGSAGKRNGGWSIIFGHTEKDSGYFDWTVRALGDFFLQSSRNEIISGYGSKMIRGSTIWNHSIKNEFIKYFDPTSGKKIIHEDIIKELTPLSMAFWYMDDGSLAYADEKNQECAISIATCSFSIADHELLIKALQKFNIESHHETYDGQIRIKINAANSEKFFLLVAPYIPQCMERKLPPRYRGGNGWLPPLNGIKRFSLMSNQKILEIEKLNNTFSKWDLETETHNYFAQNVLVHNSNFSACHDGEKLYVKSRNFYKKEDLDDMWAAAAHRLDLTTKLKDYPYLAFFGELVGNVKGFRYDAELINGELIPQVHFFDIYNTKTNRYLDYDDYRSICKSLNLKVVPELYRGVWLEKDEMYGFAERQSTLNPKHIAEGWVLSTIKERFEPRLNSRMKIKLVGEMYNLNK